MRRGIDGLLVGWLAAFVWIAVYLSGRLRIDVPVPDLTVVYWAGIVVTAAHFGLSYHLAYRDGASAMRARPFVLVGAPLAILVVLAGVVCTGFAAGPAATRQVTGWLITLVYLLTTWHYVKQVYGVGRVGAGFARVALDEWDVRLLRYGLYPLWFVGAARVLVRGTSYYLSGYSFGVPVLPPAVYSHIRHWSVLVAVPIAVAFVRIARRTHRLPPSLLLAPYVAGVLWLGLPTDPLLTVLLLAPFHALQYLAIGHRAEVAVADGEGTGRGAGWWLNIFVGAACGGLLVSRWAPQALDRHLDPAGAPLMFTAAAFVFLNLHHYLIDASIWRSKGELVRAMARQPPTTKTVTVEPICT